MRHTLSRAAGIICALALVLGLAGCSALKLGYNALPDVAYWWLDGHVDFNDAQTPAVRAELARLHAWHREEELPKLADMLARMEQLAAASVAAGQACAFVAEVQERLAAVAERAEPALLRLAASLEPAQLAHLERKYRTDNDAFRKDWIHIPLARQQEKRIERALERAGMIYGTLDEPQRAVLRASVERSIFDPARVLAERQRRQQDLLATLRRMQEAPAESRAALRGYLERFRQSPDPAYRQWQDALLHENCRTFAQLHEATTPAQREQAARRLRAYQRNLRELAAQR